MSATAKLAKAKAKTRILPKAVTKRVEAKPLPPVAPTTIARLSDLGLRKRI
jgi:hypothetical protein